MIQIVAGKRLEISEDGFLVSERDWSLPIGEGIAKKLNIEMLSDHWGVVQVAREFFAESRQVPKWTEVLDHLGISDATIRRLFHENAAENLAKIAGLPRTFLLDHLK